MANDQRRRDKKRRKEEKKKKQTIAYVNEKTRLARQPARPHISIDPTGGDPVFVKRVQDAAADIPLEVSKGCPEDVARVLDMNRVAPPGIVRQALHAEAKLNCDTLAERADYVGSLLFGASDYVGESIFSRLPEAYQQKLLPDYMFWPLLTESGFVINFQFLDRHYGEKGTFYYSNKKPTVKINDAAWAVCFSAHAIERMVERSNFLDYLTYTHYRLCAMYLKNCTHYDSITMANGQPALRILLGAHELFTLKQFYEHLKLITGQEITETKTASPAYVLGYCPVDCKGRYAAAITLLYPGYDGTPEDALVRSARISPQERRKLLDMAVGNKTVRVVNDGYHEALRWYHNHGAPQVLLMDNSYFDGPNGLLGRTP
jgi:hypothetical protein